MNDFPEQKVIPDKGAKIVLLVAAALLAVVAVVLVILVIANGVSRNTASVQETELRSEELTEEEVIARHLRELAERDRQDQVAVDQQEVEAGLAQLRAQNTEKIVSSETSEEEQVKAALEALTEQQ